MDSDESIGAPDSPSAWLGERGQHLASGFYEEPRAPLFARWCRGFRRYFEHRSLTDVHAGAVFAPSGAAAAGSERLVSPSYSFTWTYDADAAHDWLTEARASGDARGIAALEQLTADFDEYANRLTCITSVHTVGGRGYTHSIPNYGRVLAEGFDGYLARIAKARCVASETGDCETESFYASTADLIEGITTWHRRMVVLLEQHREQEPADGTRDRLLNALNRVPFRPARTFYEALVAYNFIYYLDGCDNPGRFDQELESYLRRDLATGIIDRVEAGELVREFFGNVDLNNGWSLGIGGTGRDGETGYVEMTGICLEAAAGMRRPNLQLNVRDDMPETVWSRALDCIATGCGLPALYDDRRFNQALLDADLGIDPDDLWLRNGGGCTETMMHGCSNVGSLDAGLNLPLILTSTLSRLAATPPSSFDRLLETVLTDIDMTVNEVTRQINRDQQMKAELRPHPIRTLLVDDCIDTGREYRSGGARYNWSVVNIAGIANVADSLEAIRHEVYENGLTTFSELVEALRTNFTSRGRLKSRLAGYPKFGNDTDSVDSIAKTVAQRVFDALSSRRCFRGGRFLGSCLMFVTYTGAGEAVAATPDGRSAGEPIADSAGPVQGRDTTGPTAMLKSVAALPHHRAPGTLVVNARFSRELLDTQQGRDRLRNLIETYFDLGGMQIQINVVDQRVLEEAIAHPEAHGDLIVRVGGYSEYFNRLSDELKHTLLERVEHHA